MDFGAGVCYNGRRNEAAKGRNDMTVYTRPPVLTADRSLPRKSLVMLMHAAEMQELPLPRLPEGYVFRLYQPGDIEHWARITTIVQEYDTVEAAKAAFSRRFMPQEDALRERCVFVIAPDGTVVATVMAWMFEENGVRYGRVHWVCVDPAHQGKGLGRAIVLWALNRLKEMEPGRDVYLDTQTWSHKAIGLYLRLGFHPVRDQHPVLRKVNEYTETADVLQGVLPDEVMRLFLDASVD